jgi:hypothetical protein
MEAAAQYQHLVSYRTDVQEQEQGRIEAVRTGSRGPRSPGRSGDGIRGLAIARHKNAFALANPTRAHYGVLPMVGKLRVDTESNRYGSVRHYN